MRPQLRCRQQALIAHFNNGAAPAPCGRCDVCLDAVDDAEVRADAAPARAAIEPLPADALEIVVRAVGRLTRPVGKSNLARSLRGSRAKALARGGLLKMPEHGKLADFAEASIAAAIEGLLADGRLRRTGSKYPTVWLPGKPVRATARDGGRERAGARSRRYGGAVARALDNYRKRTARALHWKTYMVFQRSVVLAIDREQPDSRAALEKIRASAREERALRRRHPRVGPTPPRPGPVTASLRLRLTGPPIRSRDPRGGLRWRATSFPPPSTRCSETPCASSSTKSCGRGARVRRDRAIDKNLFKRMAISDARVALRPGWGGAGLDYSYMAILFEEIGRCDNAGVAMGISVHTDMATPSLHQFGSDDSSGASWCQRSPARWCGDRGHRARCRFRRLPHQDARRALR